jgi:hypothetical protein
MWAKVTTPAGTFTGHARSSKAERSIEGQSPLEVAETSAVGRALGFAGFGIAEGIASADEVKAATAARKPNKFDTEVAKIGQPIVHTTPKGGQGVLANKAKLAGYMSANKITAKDILSKLGMDVADGTEAREVWDGYIETLQVNESLDEDGAYGVVCREVGVA